MHNKKIIALLLGLLPGIGLAGDSYYDVLRRGNGSEATASTPNPAAATPQDNNPTIGLPQISPERTSNQPNAATGNQAEVKTKKPLTIREEAYQQLLNQTLPLKPEQIRDLHRQIDESQRAVAAHPSTPPQPVSSTMTVDLSPGAQPPLIRLAAGFVTSIVFVDTTGRPWPVADYSLGNPKDFNVKWDSETNTLFVQSTLSYVTANMAVRLAQLDTPIVLSLVSGQKEVDYRVDLQLRSRGPNAVAPIISQELPAQTNPTLVSVLDGVPPSGSTELKVNGGDGRAWIWDGKLLFRSKLNVLSPAWSATVSSIDGTKVYEMMQTPLILASRDGETVKITLTGM